MTENKSVLQQMRELMRRINYCRIEDWDAIRFVGVGGKSRAEQKQYH